MKLLREQNSQLMGRVNTLEMQVLYQLHLVSAPCSHPKSLGFCASLLSLQNGKLERDNRDLRSRLEALSTTQDDYDLPHTVSYCSLN